MSKRICPLVSFIPLILRAWVVWHLCPDNNATRVTHFNVTFLRRSSSLGSRVFMKSRTVDRLQMLFYLGIVGLDSNTPFISLVTKGWFSNAFPFGISITVERALLAVFKELYVNPCLCFVTKKSIPFVIVPQRGLTFLEVRKISIFKGKLYSVSVSLSSRIWGWVLKLLLKFLGQTRGPRQVASKKF